VEPASLPISYQGHPHVNWKYAYERHWLYFKEWGRLLYDHETSDAVFANAFDQRFSGNFGAEMIEAYKLSTRTTQRIAQSFNFTWDHSFYTEGFIGNKRDFIKLQEMIDKAWAYLGLYFAKKIRTGVALNQKKITEAAGFIKEAQ